MDKYFEDNFKAWYRNLSNHDKTIILWCAVLNCECPEVFYYLMLDRVYDADRFYITSNYKLRDKFRDLKKFDEEAEANLKVLLNEMYRTNVMFQISKIIRKHKIFKADFF